MTENYDAMFNLPPARAQHINQPTTLVRTVRTLPLNDTVWPSRVFAQGDTNDLLYSSLALVERIAITDLKKARASLVKVLRLGEHPACLISSLRPPPDVSKSALRDPTASRCCSHCEGAISGAQYLGSSTRFSLEARNVCVSTYRRVPIRTESLDSARYWLASVILAS
ncbi:MAG: hypothetical protein L6R40_004427 [Gallowayella cf. fulva]|nr:MAG: hypothetical protein L6R40_004427 [Xanthomendoza cf. fulva]